MKIYNEDVSRESVVTSAIGRQSNLSEMYNIRCSVLFIRKAFVRYESLLPATLPTYLHDIKDTALW